MTATTRCASRAAARADEARRSAGREPGRGSDVIAGRAQEPAECRGGHQLSRASSSWIRLASLAASRHAAWSRASPAWRAAADRRMVSTRASPASAAAVVSRSSGNGCRVAGRHGTGLAAATVRP